MTTREPTAVEYLNMTVRIAPEGVFIGEYKVPGVIADGSVVVKPGGNDGINVMSVNFLVGEVIVEDPLEIGARSARVAELREVFDRRQQQYASGATEK